MAKSMDNKAYLKMMNPPTNIYYFFSSKGTIQVNTNDVVCPINIHITYLNIQGYDLENLDLETANYICFRPNQMVIQSDYIPYVSVWPRTDESESVSRRFVRDEEFNPRTNHI